MSSPAALWDIPAEILIFDKIGQHYYFGDPIDGCSFLIKYNTSKNHRKMMCAALTIGDGVQMRANDGVTMRVHGVNNDGACMFRASDVAGLLITMRTMSDKWSGVMSILRAGMDLVKWNQSRAYNLWTACHGNVRSKSSSGLSGSNHAYAVTSLQTKMKVWAVIDLMGYGPKPGDVFFSWGCADGQDVLLAPELARAAKLTAIAVHQHLAIPTTAGPLRADKSGAELTVIGVDKDLDILNIAGANRDDLQSILKRDGVPPLKVAMTMLDATTIVSFKGIRYVWNAEGSSLHTDDYHKVALASI
jgi:hypothetical protein